MCRHICPIGNATGQERNTARARALCASVVVRGAEKIDDIIDNIYECSLCGACTNNCITGWDPKIFIQEVKADAVLNGVIPPYIKDLLTKYQQTGNVYGIPYDESLKKYFDRESNILFLVGQDALYKSANSVKNACELLKKAGVNFTLNEKSNSTGSALWFLVGKTADTKQSAEQSAEIINGYEKVVVYDPVDLKFIKREWAEWGVTVKAEIIGFNAFLIDLIDSGKLNVVKSDKAYTVQDNYAYSRELDDSETVRKLVDRVGVNKEMLLNGKETNLAGHLIMNEYMKEVQSKVAANRWENAKNMDCKTLVTENPAEYELLKENCPDGYRVLSVEEMISENIK